MIKYALCHADCTTNPTHRTDVSYTEKELIQEFYNSTFIDYDTMDEYNTIEEAREFLDKQVIRTPIAEKIGNKNRVCYELYIIQQREYDGDGELLYIENIWETTGGEWKASPRNLTDDDLAYRIRIADYWSDVQDELQEIVDRAGLSAQWYSSTANGFEYGFEDVLRSAANILDVDIGI